MARKLNLSIANVGDSCYLQDHHNRRRESLLYLSFAGNESIADILQAIVDEIGQNDKIPEVFETTEKAMLAICEEIKEELEEYDCELDIQVLATW